MAYNMEILTLFLVCFFVLHNNRIEGGLFAEIEDEESKALEGRFTEADSRIIKNLFSYQINDQSSDFYVHNAGYFIPSEMLEGTRARISAWAIPEVHFNSESAVFIAVLNENNGTSNTMVAGFHVQPRLYSGNTDLRLFVGWMTGNDGHACYSITCPGFVVSNVSGAPVPGAKLKPLSTYNGEDHFITLSIKKDEETLDWSLYQDDNNNPILIGWWPKTLFNNTFDSATKIAWLGSVFYPKNETSPPMGSGHFAVEGAHKAAYISHIKIFDEFGQATDPYIGRGLTDRKDCFTTDGFKYSHHDGFHFYYGGPSGCQN